jgi:hypothetical protein
MLPDGHEVGPRLIVETKDEHDWEPLGREFAAMLRADAAKMGDGWFVPREATGIKFTMLRQQHYECAADLFGTEDFDRLFVVHALDTGIVGDLAESLRERRIFWLTVPQVTADLVTWYRAHPRKTSLRNTLVGDLWHLLVGYCRFGLPPGRDGIPSTQ